MKLKYKILQTKSAFLIKSHNRNDKLKYYFLA
jgi:hypothetical protein